MNSKDLAYYRADAERTATIEELRQKAEFAYLSIKYGMSKWYFEEVANIYLHEISLQIVMFYCKQILLEDLY